MVQGLTHNTLQDSGDGDLLALEIVKGLWMISVFKGGVYSTWKMPIVLRQLTSKQQLRMRMEQSDGRTRI